jgi:hypothetical protein
MAISAVLGVEFEVALCSRNQNWCFVTCDKDQISFHQVVL